MLDEKTLRSRILAALNAGLVVTAFDVVACGGSTETGQDPLTSVSCSSGAPQVTCWPPHETHFNVGNTPPGTPISTPAPVFDSNGCQVAEQVADGCCNPPSAGPEFRDGQCCYAFCTGACCGRPLYVDGAARVAPVVPRNDWTETESEGLVPDGLATDVREVIANEWLADAQMEHASIASFARFTLDLLAFGAPADLVRDAQQAALDEVRHARTCFAVASLYAGARFGPGPLNLKGVCPSASLGEAVVAAFREGCLGETAAALVATERARATVRPALRDVYARIAEDEARHAELAFRFVTWAIAHGDPGVARAVANAARALLAPASEAVPAVASRAAIRSLGRLSAGEIRDTERRALAEVVAPSVVMLLGASSCLRAPAGSPMLRVRT